MTDMTDMTDMTLSGGVGLEGYFKKTASNPENQHDLSKKTLSNIDDNESTHPHKAS